MAALDGITFDGLLESSRPFESKEPCCDLTPYSFVRPAGMVQLAALGHAIQQTKRELLIRVPDPNVRSYLARACLDQAVEGIATIEPGPGARVRLLGPRYQGANPMLIEVTRIESVDGTVRISV